MPEEISITELTDIDAERVDGVGSPANGTPFLMIKQAGEADRGTDAGPELDDEQALAKALDEYSRWVKAKYTADQIAAMGKKGQAFKNPDGHYSYPIGDVEDLKNAIRAVGRGGADHDDIRAFVIKRAKALGQSDLIPDNWGSDGTLKKDTPFMSMANPAGDPTTTASSPSDDSGDASVPGSPAWEADDAAALICAGQALAQIASMIECSAEREQIEVAVGHTDDVNDVWALQDALCYVQQALGIIARVAFTEDAEAGGAALSKALTDDQHDQIRKTVDLLQRLDGNKTSGAAGEKGVLTMDITQEQLDELVTKAAADAVAKADEARKVAKAEKKAAKVEKSTDGAATDPAAGDETVDPETGEQVTKSKKDKNSETDLVAEMRKAVDEAVAPLREQVEHISKQAAPGGPLASATAARMGNPKVDLAALEERFEKATDPVEKADLGERITRMKFLARITGQNPAA